MKKLLLILLIALCSNANAQYTQLYDFTGNGAFSGALPHYDQNLIAVGSAMYGMTNGSGLNGAGTIFKLMPNGTGYVKLFDFDGWINGSNPRGSLIFDGTFLYGMTNGGGINYMGTVFKIMPDGTGFVKLLDFAGATNGSSPCGSLITDGTFLYGMTARGGINNDGTLFKIMPDGTGYVKLHDFAFSNGSDPIGSLIFDGTFLYGMTSDGGTNGMGTLFKIKPNGTSYAKLLDFAGAANGSEPLGSLIFDGTFLYGMTYQGGNGSYGTVFKIMPNGTGYLKLLDFAGTNGMWPYGSLISDGTFLYGMTKNGGTNGYGTIFKIMPDGTGYSKLLDYAGIDGIYPNGSLIFDGTFLYGMTKYGGTNYLGTVFKIMSDGTGFVKLLDFADAINGKGPTGDLVSDGTFLYGMTVGGGVTEGGVIFKILPDGTGYIKLLDFTYTINGGHPFGSLITDGTFLYGLTSDGGTNNMGVVFKILPDGTGYVKLLDLDSANGSNPQGSLIFDGTFLFGMTKNGGTNNLGTVFKIKPDGTGYVKLLDFAGAANGSNPNGSLMSDGTFLYGMTSRGGTSDFGTIFKILPDGTGYVKLLDLLDSVNGRWPDGSLISDGTFLYGMTSLGGANYEGTLFKILPDGTGYVKLLDFGTATGHSPRGSLFYDGTFLYGMTSYGTTNSRGTLFKIMPDGTNYTTLVNFIGTANGSYAQSSLISDGTFLYGMTGQGGPADAGTIFKYQYCTPVTANATAIYVCSGSSVTLTGGGATNYVWSGGITDGVAFVPTATATYSVTGTGGNSCTNTATITITVEPTFFSQSTTVCPGQSVTVGTNTYTASGTYTDSLTSINGCDSIVTTNLTVLPANTFSQSPSICPGQYITVGNNIYTISGTYIDSLTSMNGCDSIVTTNLTVLTASTFSLSPVICSGQSFIVGANNYTSSGTYIDVFTAMNGCDSTVTTNLTVLPAISNSVTIVPATCGNNNGSASVNPSGGGGGFTFIWSNSDTTSTVTGLTGSPADTLYVTITDANGCTLIDTAIVNCLTGVDEWSMENQNLIIYPNPNSGQFTITTTEKQAEISILNTLGEIIFTSTNNQQKSMIDISNQPSGIYFFQLKSENGIETRKIIKQ